MKTDGDVKCYVITNNQIKGYLDVNVTDTIMLDQCCGNTETKAKSASIISLSRIADVDYKDINGGVTFRIDVLLLPLFLFAFSGLLGNRLRMQFLLFFQWKNQIFLKLSR